MKSKFSRMLSVLLVLSILIGSFVLTGYSSSQEPEARAKQIVQTMTLDEKISQMIIPSIRTWNEENITDINAVPQISEALRRHQYGGLCLFRHNITGNEQITRLLHDLQENNRNIEGVSTHIPYLTSVDEEGGIVIRLTSGTRMTGNMAIGATSDAENNAEITGMIIGEEMSAVGFNTDFAPDIDVNSDPNNPVIGTRSFSDDPNTVAALGISYVKGLEKSNIIAAYKHFPGHGDTDVDSHIGTPSVEKTYDELKETELVPFKAAIDAGADMIMTAHITYPLIDEEKTFGDGVTKGFYPATMSHKMITDILRTDLGFNGVVVTDALEMDAIGNSGIVPGGTNYVEYSVNIAKEVINSDVDLLLIPLDMKNEEAIAFYDGYISGIASKVESGEISQDTIDESVTRILTLKLKYGIMYDDETPDIEKKVADSITTVGSREHHDAEIKMAREAITVVKNEGNTLPVSKDTKNIFVLGRQSTDANTLQYVVNELKKNNYIADDANINIDYYYDSSADVQLHYPDDMKEKISSSDIVIGLSYANNNSALDKENPQYIGVSSAIEDTHAAGGKFILLSSNLPYDAAIFTDADAIVLAYMGFGLGTDPTEKTDSGTGMKAMNANIIAAMETIFGANKPQGHLPVNVPEVKENSDGTLIYGDTYLYNRGFGITD
ncbi:glycoside hydrolase family 3 protein [Butyrivibrio sp. XPD2002]|uniref:glycoside hydrolase family 3 protein n=1 Tax=Butyrivibrio sp. XPD2002 TaxID=1280665 RepID=UPI000425242D|nr:glycoside hydrolase family 3 protein [Butyrivibrio sp. XPD2002]